MKNCKSCGKLKEPTDFRVRLVNGKEYVAYTCRACDAAQRAGKVVKRLYDCTPEQYHQMVIAQNGSCEICGDKNPGNGRMYFPIDHCHKTNKVRGLLCSDCNTALGLMKESPRRLLAAAAYVERFESKKLEIING